MRLYCEHETSYETSGCRIHLWISRESDATLSRSRGLFQALEAELSQVNLIRNFSLMQWNLDIKSTSNYSLEMALQVYIKIRS